MDTKSLKKQLGAAIAMVLVAGTALSSATYAWFVTNNTVTATTTTISAQSNAAFMTIANGTTGAKDSSDTSVTTEVKTEALYPATYVKVSDNTAGTWKTGYGTGLEDATLLGQLKECTGPNNKGDDGSTAAAIDGEFILDQDYNISAKAGQTLSDLKVDSVTAKTGEDSTSSLKTALRILVTDASGNKWAVYGLKNDQSGYEVKSSSVSSTSSEGVVYSETITPDVDTAVHVYLYYEGSDANVTTANLVGGKLTATNAVTVTFTATPNNK